MFPTIRHRQQNKTVVVIDDDNEWAYWLEPIGLIRAPTSDGFIDGSRKEHVDFEMVSLNPYYYIHILDKIREQ